MAEEYRIAVGIDASGAKEGAAEASNALDQLTQSAEAAAVKVDKLDVSLAYVNKTADGTKTIREVSRSLDDVSASTETLTSATEVLREAQQGLLTNLSGVAQTATSTLKSLAADTESSVEALTKALDTAGEPVDNFILRLKALMDQGNELAGQLLAGFDQIVKQGLLTEQQLSQLGGVSAELAEKLGQQVFDEAVKRLDKMAAAGKVVESQLDGMSSALDQFQQLATASESQLLLEQSERLTQYFSELVPTLEIVRDKTKELAETEGEAAARIKDMVQASLDAKDEQERAGMILAYLRESTAKVTEATEEQIVSVDTLGKSYADFTNELQVFEDAMRNAPQSLDDVIERREWLNDLMEAGQVSHQFYADALKDLDSQERVLVRTLEERLDAQERLRRELDPIPAKLEEIAEKERAWNDLLKQGTINAEEYARGIKNLADQRDRINNAQAGSGGGGVLDDLLDLLGGRGGGGGGVLRQLVRAFGPIAAGVLSVQQLAQATTEGVRSAIAYEAEMVKVQNAMGATNEQTRELQGAVEDLAYQFGNTKLEETQAALTIVNKGYRDTAEAVQLLAASNHLADATFTDVSTAAYSLASVMSAFSKEASEATDVANMLAVASHGDAEAMQMMASMTSRLGAQLAQSGIALDEYLVVLSALKESGMETRRAMAGLTQMMEQITNATPAATAEFARYGIEISKARIQQQGIIPILKEIVEKTGNNKAALQSLLGSQQAATVAMTLMKNEGEGVAKAMDHMAHRTEIAAKQAERVNDTFKKLSSDLTNRVRNSFTSLGMTFTEVGKGALRMLNLELASTIRLLDYLQTIETPKVFKEGLLGAFAKQMSTLGSNMSQTAFLERFILLYNLMGQAAEDATDKLDRMYGRQSRYSGQPLASKVAEDEANAVDWKEMNENFRQRAKQIYSSDPISGVMQRAEELKTLLAGIEQDTTLGADVKQGWIAAVRRELEGVNLQIIQLINYRSPVEEFWRKLQASVSPVAAATQAYEDRVRELSAALKAGQISFADYTRALNETAYALVEAEAGVKPQVAAALAYARELDKLAAAHERGALQWEEYRDAVALAHLEYSRVAAAGSKMDQAIRGITEEMDPALKLQREYNEALDNARVVLAGMPEQLAQYEEKLAAVFRERTQLQTLEQDQLVQLAAQYDPVIAKELERTEALIRMQSAVAQMKVSEQERAQVAVEFQKIINERYDKEVAQIQGSITLADAWKEAWRSAIERVDTAFVDLWKSMFAGSKKFLDQLEDMAKQVFAEIMHSQITRPLMMGVVDTITGGRQGEGVSGGVLEQVKKTLSGVLGMQTGEGGNKPFATKASAEQTIENGIRRAFAGPGGGTTLFGSALGGTTDLLEQFTSGIEGLGDLLGGTMMQGAEALESAADSLADGSFFSAKSYLAGQPGGNAALLDTITRSATQAAEEIAAGGGGGGGVPSWAGTLGNSLAKLSKTFGAFTGTMQASAASFFMGNQVVTTQTLGAYASGGASGWGAIAGQGLAGAGTGLLSGWAVNELLGGRGDAGRNAAFSGIGGAIGSLWGPIGSLVGGAIGSLVDNIIGGGKKIKEFGYKIAVEGGEMTAQYYEKIKKYGSWFSSKTVFTYKDVEKELLRALSEPLRRVQDSLRTVADALNVSTGAIDDFSASLTINLKKIKEKDREAYLQQQMLNLAGKQVLQFVNETEGLSDRFKKMVGEARDDYTKLERVPGSLSQRRNYSEEFFEVFQLIAALEAAFQTIPSALSGELFDDANKSMSESYVALTETAKKAADQYDGSRESLEKLTTAFIDQRQAAVELALSLRQVEQEMSGMFADTAESIRKSLMSPEELYGYMKDKAEDMADLMLQTTDPGELRSLAMGINEIVNSLYGSLDESQRAEMAGGFLEFLDGVDAILKQQVEMGLGAIDDSASDFNDVIDEILRQKMGGYTTDPANFSHHVDIFGEYIRSFGVFVAKLTQAQTTQTAPAPTTQTNTAVAAFFRLAAREVNA